MVSSRLCLDENWRFIYQNFVRIIQNLPISLDFYSKIGYHSARFSTLFARVLNHELLVIPNHSIIGGGYVHQFQTVRQPCGG